jgi:hypothetical protein
MSRRQSCVEAGLIKPTGYSSNLDAVSIYLTLAAVFIAQSTTTPLARPDPPGNCVATVAVAAREQAIDIERARSVLHGTAAVEEPMTKSGSGSSIRCAPKPGAGAAAPATGSGVANS